MATTTRLSAWISKPSEITFAASQHNFCYMGLMPLINLTRISSSRTQEQQATESVLFDSGANCCITNRKEDFVGPFVNRKGETIDGIGKGLAIHGAGHVAWTFVASNGAYRTLKLPCYYVPSSNARIAATGRIMEVYPQETISIDGKSLTLSGDPQNNRPAISVPYCTKYKLPMAGTIDRAGDRKDKGNNDGQDDVRDEDEPPPLTARPAVKRKPKSKPRDKPPSTPSLTVPTNYNLGESEKELLRWHHRLGHVGIKRIQWLFRQGILSTTERNRHLQTSASKLTHIPLCTACQFAKQRRKTTPGTTKRAIPEEQDALKKDKTFPGQRVSADHFHCNPKGRLIHTYGKESKDQKFSGGCIFVDHASGYVHVELQQALNSHQTLQAKKGFESFCNEHGVVVQEYLTDNGTAFRNADFTAHLEQFHQTILHPAVGAHHGNGVAERSISTVMSISRAMMHHAALHWPDVCDTALWPMATMHAVYILNRLPREDTGLSALELFTRIQWPRKRLHDLHVWGCPVYVLQDAIADGKKLPRWQPRSSRCMYVGVSGERHHSSVPSVLNLETGKISHQFHVVFDDQFQTVSTSESELPDFNHEDWYETFGATEWQYVPDDDEPPLEVNRDMELTLLNQVDQRLLESEGASNDIKVDQKEAPTPTVETTSAPTATTYDGSELPGATLEPAGATTNPAEPTTLTTEGAWTEVVRRTPRKNTPTTPSPAIDIRTIEDVSENQREVKLENNQSASSETMKSPRLVLPRSNIRTRRQCHEDLPLAQRRTRRTSIKSVNVAIEDTKEDVPAEFWYNMISNCGFKAAKTDPDTYNWQDAMNSPYKDQFLKAAQEEIDALERMETWYEDSKSNATTRVVPSQWVFKIKRTPDGEVKKFKARIVLRGDLQEYEGETFSPVASWSTVRAVLVHCAVKGWVTCSINFSNAFIQSPLPEGEAVWMHVPQGYKSDKGPGYCLKLVKSLYGHKVAPLLWFKHMTQAFERLGLKQSQQDQCLWYGKEMILVCYVDDVQFGAPNHRIIDDFVTQLRSEGFQLTKEDTFAEFLGIKFTNHPNGTIKMTQAGLITKVLTAAGMEDCNQTAYQQRRQLLAATKMESR